jgi:hypothetical protein
LKEPSIRESKVLVKGMVGLASGDPGVAIYSDSGIQLFDSEGFVRELTKLSMDFIVVVVVAVDRPCASGVCKQQRLPCGCHDRTGALESAFR